MYINHFYFIPNIFLFHFTAEKILSFIFIFFIIFLLSFLIEENLNKIKFLHFSIPILFSIFFLGFEWSHDLFLNNNDFLDIPWYLLKEVYTYFELPSLNINIYENFTFLFLSFFIFLIFLGLCNNYWSKVNKDFEFSWLLLLFFIASIFLIASNHLIEIFISLECISLCSYALIGFERLRKLSAVSGIQYLILSSVPSGLLTLGFIFLYQNFGLFEKVNIELLLETTLNPFFEFFWFELGAFSNFTLFQNYEFALIKESEFVTHFINHAKSAQFLLSGYCKYVSAFFDINEFHTFSNYKYWSMILNSNHWITLFNANEVSHNLYLITDQFLYFWWTFYFYAGDVIGLKEIPLASSMNHFWLTQFFSWCNFTTEDFVWQNFLTTSNYWKDLKYQIYNIENYKTTVEFNNNENFENFFIQNYKYQLGSQDFFSTNFDSILGFKISSHLYQLPDFSYNFFFQNLTEYSQQLWNNFLLDTEFINIKENIFLSKYFFISVKLAVLLFIVNFMFKITGAPFHIWAPAIYNNGPTASVFFLAVFSKLTIFLLMIQLFSTIFYSLKNDWSFLFYIISILSIFIGMFGAFNEKFIKKFFVYSSMTDVGFILLGFSFYTSEVIKYLINYLFVYNLSTIFIWFILLYVRTKTKFLTNLQSILINNSILILLFSLNIFSLAGIPPFGGFFIKFDILVYLILSSNFMISFLILTMTVVNFYYYLRLIKILYFEQQFNKDQNFIIDNFKLFSFAFLINIICGFEIYMQNSFVYILDQIVQTLN